MSYPPPPGGGDQPPYDPNQPPYGGYGQGGYGQGGYGQTPGGYGAPTQNHPKAITSLVLGILGVVCCTLAAPFAWVTGKKTMGEIDHSGGRLGGRGLAQAGYILGIIGTVLLVLSLLFLIVAALTGGLNLEAGTNVE